VVFWNEKTESVWYFGYLVFTSGILALVVLASGILAIVSVGSGPKYQPSPEEMPYRFALAYSLVRTDQKKKRSVRRSATAGTEVASTGDEEDHRRPEKTTCYAAVSHLPFLPSRYGAPLQTLVRRFVENSAPPYFPSRFGRHYP
jgi:hypothetical protein